MRRCRCLNRQQQVRAMSNAAFQRRSPNLADSFQKCTARILSRFSLKCRLKFTEDAKRKRKLSLRVQKGECLVIACLPMTSTTLPPREHLNFEGRHSAVQFPETKRGCQWRVPC